MTEQNQNNPAYFNYPENLVQDKKPMSEWKEYKLGEILNLITKGTTPPQGVGFVEKGINYIKSDAIGYDGKLDRSKFVQIDSQTHEKFKRSQLREDDILFSMAGIYLGKNAIVPKDVLPANTNQALAILRLNQHKALSKYVSYYLSQSQIIDFVNNMSGQSAQPNINFEEIKCIEISLPPFPEQLAIASVLSSLDDKIDLLHRQNQTLEKIAETLFRQWFVEEAKEDWVEKQITDLFEIKDGTHDSPKQKEFGKKLITSKHISGNSIDFETAYYISDEDYNLVNKRSKVDSGDILFSMIGTIGLIYLEQSKEINYAIKNIGLFKTSQNNDWIFYTYLWLKSTLGNEFIHENKSGSTQEYISLGSLRSIIFSMPPLKLLSTFNDVVNPIFQKLKNNKIQIRTLSTLRDTLLPKLMSGEVRVEIV
jgi:type I restriction enzyme, S subunit